MPARQDEFVERSYSYEPRHGTRRSSNSFVGSCCGAAFGVGLLLAATALLWTNEGAAVRAQRSLLDARDALASADSRGLVHASGMLTVPGDRPLEDGSFGVASNAISLERIAEVYQWREHTETQKRRVPDGRGGEVTEKTTTHRYDAAWEGREVSSTRFRNPQGHYNPPWSEALAAASASAGDLPFRAAAWQAQAVHLEGLALGPTLRSKATRLASLEPASAEVRRRIAESRAVLAGRHVYSEGRCAPPHEPRVGCVRISWKHSPLEEVSLIGRRSGRGGAPAGAASAGGELHEWQSSAGPGYEVALLHFGYADAHTMLDAASQEARVWTWLKRAGGLLLTWAGWALVFGPAQYLVTWIPLLSGVAGCLLAVLAMGLALAHGLIIIATAWIAYRPLLGATLLAVAGASLFVVISHLRGRSGSSSTASSTGAKAAKGGAY